MPDWMDKYSVDVPGTTIDQPTQGGWMDKYLVNEPKQKKEKGIDWAGLGRDVALSGGIQYLTGPGLPISMAAQGAYGLGSDLYDTWKEKGIGGINKEDLLHALVKGGISSLGPLGSRLLSPMLPKVIPRPASATGQAAVNRADREGIEALSDQVLEEMAKRGELDALRRHVPEMSNSALPSSGNTTRELPTWAENAAKHVAHSAPHVVGGGVLGELLSPGVAGPLLGMVGGYATANAPQLAKAYWNNSFMHSPIQQAIMNQLARSAGEQTADILKY